TYIDRTCKTSCPFEQLDCQQVKYSHLSKMRNQTSLVFLVFALLALFVLPTTCQNATDPTTTPALPPVVAPSTTAAPVSPSPTTPILPPVVTTPTLPPVVTTPIIPPVNSAVTPVPTTPTIASPTPTIVTTPPATTPTVVTTTTKRTTPASATPIPTSTGIGQEQNQDPLTTPYTSLPKPITIALSITGAAIAVAMLGICLFRKYGLPSRKLHRNRFTSSSEEGLNQAHLTHRPSEHIDYTYQHHKQQNWPGMIEHPTFGRTRLTDALSAPVENKPLPPAPAHHDSAAHHPQTSQQQQRPYSGYYYQ
ncbi:uncharacterized protein SPPG_05045, partial [Spizellomyces punctatus DAOM BR117]